MKGYTLLLTVLCALVAGFVIPVYGQTGEVAVRVPFSFILENKAYPAGQYAFSLGKDHIVLHNGDGTPIAMILANHVSGRSAGETGRVFFECYFDECFLSQVWVPGHEDGRQLFRSRREREVAAKQPGKYMALMGTRSQPR